MSDKALENAKEARKQLLDRKRQVVAELSEIDSAINEIDQFVKSWHIFAEGGYKTPVNNNESLNENEGKTFVSQPKKATGNSRKEDVATTAREIIIGRGQPIMRDELYGLLTAKGLIIDGKDPQMVLSTMLWRMRSTIARLDSGYWPADVPNEAIGYDPQKNSDFNTMQNTELAATGDGDSDAELPEDVRSLV